MGWREEGKRRAAGEAARHVENGFTVGLGSGSTVAYAIKAIGKRIQRNNLKVLGVPTSHQVAILATRCGIPMTTLNEHPRLDLTIDGADQIDGQLNLIKGAGGALMREKIVGSVAEHFIAVVDETKLTKELGSNCSVPIEVLPFALTPIVSRIQRMGGKPILREATRKVGPIVTDNGNFVIDVDFGFIDKPKDLDMKLHQIPGVVETGLFIGIAKVAYVGTPTKVEKLEKR